MLNFEKISQQLLRKPEEVCDFLNIEYHQFPNRLSMKCPIHNSNADDKCCIFTEGQKAIGNWVCWSGNCHVKYGRDIVGFVRGVLSVRMNKEVGRGEVISYLARLINEEDSEVKFGHVDKISEIFQEKEESFTPTVGRKDVISKLNIPSKYYIERGFSSEILSSYDIGECYTKGKPMFLRAVVPVYDFNYNVVGVTGRSIQPSCTKCKYCHYSNLPCPNSSMARYQHSKWINSKGFNKTLHLYNLIKAKDEINRTNTAILVEGPGDVWRLEESGIHNSLAMFGLSLNDSQLKILEKLSINNLICLTDTDDAGLEARQVITDKCSRIFNIHHIDLPKKDIGEMSVLEVQRFLLPKVVEINKRGI